MDLWAIIASTQSEGTRGLVIKNRIKITGGLRYV
jgi:hypothetical protein